MSKIKIIAAVMFLIAFASISYGLYKGTVCQQDQLCKYEKNCTGTVCRENIYECMPCEPARKWCNDGTLAMCPTTCQSSATGARCSVCEPDCGAAQEKAWVGSFTVYVNRSILLSVVPSETTVRPGGTITYNIHIENQNLQQTSVEIGVEVPSNWSYEQPNTITLNARGYQDFQVPVYVSKSTDDGTYYVNFVAATQAYGDTVTSAAVYVLSRQQAELSLDPAVQTGTAEKPITYTLSIINNDDPIYDPTTYYLTPQLPRGWKAQMPSRVVVSPGNTLGVSINITSNNTPAGGMNNFTIAVSYSGRQENLTAALNVVFCGDGVCNSGEESSCPADCPAESTFICGGRCEMKTDTGVNWSARMQGFIASDFIVCDRKATRDSCLLDYDKANCEVGEFCICGNAYATSCAVDCYDRSGTYYLAAKGPGGDVFSANYSYECPAIGLNELKDTAANFTASIIQYERGQSMLLQKIHQSKTAEERSQYQPCYDALGLIIANISGHVDYMNEVISRPSMSGAAEARARTRDVRYYITQTYQNYCGASSPKGFLVIDSITAPASTEEGYEANATVQVRNIDTADYYSYVECTWTAPTNQSYKSAAECKQMPYNTTKAFVPGISSNITGDWKVKCRAYGSFSSDCLGAQLHSESETLTFNIYSEKVYVADVSGLCITDVGANCTVGTNANFPDCVGCRLNNKPCSLLRREKGISVFGCPTQPIGYYNLTGFVYMTEDCIPVVPEQKTMEIRCGGCGDGIVEGSEQCETPNTPNNAYCGQAEFECKGMKYGTRDKLGYCGLCKCFYDTLTYSCDRERCGAECSDGDVQIKTIKNDDGDYCTCIQQCGPDCAWAECSCEPTRKVIGFIYPYEGSTVQGAESIKVTTMFDNASFAYSSMDPTCDGSKWVMMYKLTTGVFEYKWDTTLVRDGSYYICAKGFDSVSEQMATLRDIRNSNYGFVLDYIRNYATTTLNRSTELSFSIRNRGTAGDTYSISRADSSSWATVIKINGAQGTRAEVAAGQTADVAVTITPSASAKYGDSQTIKLVVRSGKTSDSRTVEFTTAIAGGTNTAPKIIGVFADPQNVAQGRQLTFYADVADVDSSNVYVDFCRDISCNTRICSGTASGTTYSCSMNVNQGIGTYSYYAFARDSSNSYSVSDRYTYTVYNLSKMSGLKNATAGLKGACLAAVSSKKCSYDNNANRFEVQATVSWSGGNHGHAEIEGDMGKMYYDNPFTATKTISKEGWNSVVAYVHDADNNIICMNSTLVYCSKGGTSEGSLVDVSRIAGDTNGLVKVGDVSMKLIVAPARSNNIKLAENMKSGLVISKWSASGNSTPVTMSSPASVVLDSREYTAYTWDINANAYENITISYTTKVSEAGLYKFIALANYTGGSAKKELTIEATNCDSLVSTYATSASGECTYYKTPCLVLKGWTPVERCPTKPLEPMSQQEGIDIILIIIIVAAAAVVALLVWKREAVIEFFQDLIDGIRNRGEPSA
jgi:hypothetical protein